MGLQILLDRLTQYTIAFSMDKDNLLSVIKSVLIHHLTEFSQLVRQHIRIAQSIRIIQQFGYMQIDLKDSAIRRLLFHDLPGNPTFLTNLLLHSFLQLRRRDQ